MDNVTCMYVLYIYLGIYTCIHIHRCVTAINEKKAINLKENRRGIWENLEEGKNDVITL